MRRNGSGDWGWGAVPPSAVLGAVGFGDASGGTGTADARGGGAGVGGAALGGAEGGGGGVEATLGGGEGDPQATGSNASHHQVFSIAS